MRDFLADFAGDEQFQRLLTRRGDVELASAALELARDGQPGLDFAPTLNWIDERARELAGPLSRATSDAALLHELSECLARRHGVTGSDVCYSRAESSYLNRAIELRTGLPITLSVMYMAVAERAGISLRGVGAPRHFLTRYETLDEPLFVDPFGGGAVLTLETCLTRVRQWAGLDGTAALAALEAVEPRAIIMRMLNNLKALYAQQEDWRACWKVQHRLLALSPGSFHERRDWALVSLRADRAGPAVDMLEDCLRTCPPDERAVLEAHLAEARQRLAQWN